MATPVISNLPPAPVRADGAADFTVKADAFVAALQPMVVQLNSSFTWMATTMAATEGYKTQAAQSATNAQGYATSAADQVSLAEAQVALAVTARQDSEAARDEAQAYANAAGAGAGIPAYVDALDVLMINETKTGTKWGKVGQAIGDVLVTARPAPPSGYLLPGTIYSKSAYPELAALVGSLELNVDAANFSNVTVNFPSYPSRIVAGKDDVIFAVGGTGSDATGGWGRKSTDGGLTWSVVPGLTGVTVLYDLATDDNGTWIAAGYNSFIYRSTDNGASWTAISVPIALNSGARVSTNKLGEWVIARGDTQVVRSANNGASWAQIVFDSAVPVLSYCADSAMWFRINSSQLEVHRSPSLTATSGWLYVALTNTGMSLNPPIFEAGVGVMALSPIGILVTTDGGVNWRLSKIGNAYGNATHYLDKDGVITITQNSAAAGARVIRSYDFGESWIEQVGSGVMVNFDSNSRICTKTKSGTCISLQNSNTLSRSVRQLAYDSATQFKTPKAQAPKSMKAYIKGKAA